MDEDMKKAFESDIKSLNESIVEKDARIAELEKSIEEASAVEEEPVVEEKVEEPVVEEKAVNEINSELNKTIEDLKSEIEKLKSEPVNKGKLAPSEEEDAEAKKQLEVAEKIKSGQLPIMRG